MSATQAKQFTCPEASEYGCKGKSGQKKLHFLYGYDASEYGMDVRYDWYRCSVCRSRFVSKNGGEPQIVTR
jgi:hypothetical protein